MKTVVLGSGGWGTALSLVLHRNGHPVTLWSHVPEKAAYMERARENPRLEGVPLPPELRLTADMACLTEAELVVVAVPSYAVRETAHAAAPLLRPDTLLVTAAKGIERDTHLRMSQILEQETGGAFPIAALSGPSHAEEVGRGLPTGCVAASVSQAAALTVQDAFMNDRFRVYTSPDIVGVELSGALKNVVALACGICDGMGYQDNTKALLMTRAMVELCHLGPPDLRRAGGYGRPDRHLHLHALPEPPGGHPAGTGQVRRADAGGDRRRGGGLLCRRQYAPAGGKDRRGDAHLPVRL